jgi:hypothetical protein
MTLPGRILFVAVALVGCHPSDQNGSLTPDEISEVRGILDRMSGKGPDMFELRSELHLFDGFEAVAWKYVETALEAHESDRVGAGIFALEDAPNWEPYLQKVRALVESESQRLPSFDAIQSKMRGELSGQELLEVRTRFALIHAGIGVLPEEDESLVLSFLNSSDSSVRLKVIGWLAGKGNKGTIEILERVVASKESSESDKDRAVHAIRNIEQRLGMPVRSPRRKAGGAPLPLPTGSEQGSAR